MVTTWQLKVFNIDYIYKPTIKNKRSVNNQISLYWNKNYRFLVEHIGAEHMDVSDLRSKIVMTSVYIHDNKIFSEWPSLTSSSGTILKDATGRKVDIPDYYWSIIQASCELLKDGMYKTSLYITGRQQYWHWTGLKYKEDKVERIFNTI